MDEEPKRISRRMFITLAGAGTAAYAMSRLRIGRVEGKTNLAETKAEPLSRKEYFKPFNEGSAEWQYVEFQYENDQGERIGVTTSMSELTDPITFKKTQQLLVMNHNLDTGNTKKSVYDGIRTFDEATSTYTFTHEGGEKLAEFSYNEASDNYTLSIQTDEFSSNEIDSDGLILNPQGNLIPVSGDGNFTVFSYNGGSVDTNYYANNILVQRQDGVVVGAGRHDNENLVFSGKLPTSPLDIDHNWVHVSAELETGELAFVTAWQSGNDTHKFADIQIVNQETGESEIVEFNEDDPDFALTFEPNQFETPPHQTQGSNYQIGYGGKVTAHFGETKLFEVNVKGAPGQIINGKGFFNMVEAQASVSGLILEKKSKEGGAVWESTVEKYSQLLPLVVNGGSRNP